MLAEVGFLVVGTVLLAAAMFVRVEDSSPPFSRQLLLFGAYVFIISALILGFLDVAIFGVLD